MKRILFIVLVLFHTSSKALGQGAFAGTLEPKDRNKDGKAVNPPANSTKPSKPSSTPNYYTGTDKSPVESMNDFNFLDKSNPGSNQGGTSNDGFVNGGTLDFRTPAQRAAEEKCRQQAEIRATFQNINNNISDLGRALNEGQRNALSNTQEKIRNAQSQINDQYRQADDTGLLRSSHQNEVSTEDLALEEEDRSVVQGSIGDYDPMENIPSPQNEVINSVTRYGQNTMVNSETLEQEDAIEDFLKWNPDNAQSYLEGIRIIGTPLKVGRLVYENRDEIKSRAHSVGRALAVPGRAVREVTDVFTDFVATQLVDGTILTGAIIVHAPDLMDWAVETGTTKAANGLVSAYQAGKSLIKQGNDTLSKFIFK